MEVLPVWILGVVINIFLFYLLSQNYLSPFTPVSQAHETNMSTGIKRVVVFVADGLRADTFFENPQSRPGLEIVMRSGFSASGISMTRAPTFSENAFGAMFAGVYPDTAEKLRAIWTRHPHQFDTVFNRTSFTLLLGCAAKPIQELSQGAGREKIHAEIYVHPKNGSSEGAAADTWIRDRFRAVLNLKMVSSESKILIVLHFMGPDFYGHEAVHKADHNLLKSLAFIDESVAEAERRLNNHFGDNRSMFIFTSDHGMRFESYRKGAHGSGLIAEIETPFVIWGKGIQKRVSGLRMAQVDMAAFLSSALNIPFPVHSLGIVPTDIWQDKTFAYDTLQANFRQFYDRMTARRNLVDLGGILFRPFRQEDEIMRLLKSSSEVAENQDFENAITKLKKAMNLTLKGLSYYETSGTLILPLLAVYTFICWIPLIVYVILNFERKTKLEFFTGSTIMAEILLSLFVFRGLLGWSLGRLGCVLFTLHLTQLLCTTLRREQTLRKLMRHRNLYLTYWLGVGILITVLYNRQVMTICLILLGFWTVQGKVMSPRDKLLWATSLTVLGIFPLLPVVGKSKSSIFLTLGPLVCGFISLWSLKQLGAAKSACDALRKRDRALLYFQTVLVFSVCFLIHFPESVLTRFVAWTSLPLSCTVPFFVTAASMPLRLLSVFLAIATPICFLSFTYDSLFLPALYVALCILLKLEATDKSSSPDPFWSLSLSFLTSSGSTHLELIHAFRQAWLLICFHCLSVFGTDSVENIQRMKYVEIANCFLSPVVYPMTIVPAVVRILGPLVLVAVFFRFLLKSHRDKNLLYLIVLLISQPVALFTFFNLRHDGDENDIGISVARYIIPQAMTPGLAVFQWIGSTLVGSRTL